VKVRVAAHAARQARAVDAWWREHRGDRDGFIDELASALERLAASPDLGALYEPRAAQGVRRLLLPASQHYVYYVHLRERQRVRILAIWSCYRGRGPGLASVLRKGRAGT
jgi:plasmid stabilization system protein ParE